MIWSLGVTEWKRFWVTVKGTLCNNMKGSLNDKGLKDLGGTLLNVFG